MAKSMYDSVCELLEARKGEWRQIAEDSGVPYSTLCKIAQGWIPNPNVHTVQILFDFLTSERAA